MSCLVAKHLTAKIPYKKIVVRRHEPDMDEQPGETKHRQKKFIFDETDDRFLQEAFFNLFL